MIATYIMICGTKKYYIFHLLRMKNILSESSFENPHNFQFYEERLWFKSQFKM